MVPWFLVFSSSSELFSLPQQSFNLKCASPWGLQIELNLDQAKLLLLDSVFIDLIPNTVLYC